MGARGLWEVGVEGAGSEIPNVAESGRNRRKVYNIVQKKKAQRGQIGREPGLKGTGSGEFKPPVPPPNKRDNVKAIFLSTEIM